MSNAGESYQVGSWCSVTRWMSAGYQIWSYIMPPRFRRRSWTNLQCWLVLAFRDRIGPSGDRQFVSGTSVLLLVLLDLVPRRRVDRITGMGVETSGSVRICDHLCLSSTIARRVFSKWLLPERPSIMSTCFVQWLYRLFSSVWVSARFCLCGIDTFPSSPPSCSVNLVSGIRS